MLMVLLVCAPAACQPDRDGGPRVSTVTGDSAGVHIVENGRLADGSRLPWRIGPEPSASIGVLEGEEPYMLHYAADATRLADGRIVVANASTQELRVFDASGIHVATWGGEGEGPGEFSGLSHVERWRGDSIVAWYAPRMGMSVFDADGNYGRTFRLADETAWFWPVSAATDGSILAIHDPEDADTVVAHLRDGEGQVRSSFGTHPGSEPYIMGHGEQEMLFWKTFGRRPVWAPWGDRIAIGHTRRYEIKAFRQDGSLERIVRRGHAPRVPTRADVEAYVEERVEANLWREMSESEAESLRVRLRRQFQAVPVAEHFPAFESIMTDAADHLWVEEYESPTDDFPARLWTVFDPEGRVLGFFETPKGWRIYEIGEDYFLVWAQTELDVETVQLRALGR